MDDIRTIIVEGASARDYGKRFRLTETDPLTFSGFVLRLVAALKVDSYESLLDQIKSGVAADRPPIDLVMSTLSGCDPKAVHALVTEALEGIEVAADPRHPEGFRPLMRTDIRDLATLGAILTAFAKLNFAG
ncbi:hypothetical protein [Paraburkholderia sp.]|jgi:hypothetical protein|uniref:hypothetical protein n=1 Tax=Paraburkholderia sp. TaxID=1926495 RepID=UPI002F405C11